MFNAVKSCCIIGHRKITITEALVQELRELIEDLIVDKNVSVFIFGSRSQFNDLCHEIVTELKIKYPHVKRIMYTCSSEVCILEKDREKEEQKYFEVTKKQVHFLGFEGEVEHKTKYTSGKASYVERNQAMIDDSDICLIYYKEDYAPDKRKHSKKDLNSYQPKSGTKLAYEYIKQKKKNFINVVNF